MNRLLTAILLSLISGAAVAADFRVMNFGESCDEIARREQDLGSIAVDEQHRSYQKYEGRYLDRTVHVYYGCGNNGQFQRGTYVYEFDTLGKAKAFFKHARRLLMKTLGKPKVDSSSPEYAKLMSKRGIHINADDKYTLYWRTDGMKILMSAQKRSAHSGSAVVGIDFTSTGSPTALEDR